jgi:hypothetical protein
MYNHSINYLGTGIGLDFNGKFHKIQSALAAQFTKKLKLFVYKNEVIVYECQHKIIII